MMKKLLALLLAALMLTSVLTACSSDEPETNNNAESVTDTDTNDTNETEDGKTEDETEQPSDGEADTETEVDPDMNQPAADPNAPVEDDMNQPAADPNAPATPEVNAPSEPTTPEVDTPAIETPEVETPAVQPSGDSLESVIEAIYGAYDTGLGSLMTMPVDIADADALRYYTGLSDGSLVVEAAVSEPMMSSQAYSLVVVRVADASQAESVAQQIMAGVDPMKWLCVSADDMSAAVSGDLVMFAMIDANFENMDAVDLSNAFVSLYGGSVVA